MTNSYLSVSSMVTREGSTHLAGRVDILDVDRTSTAFPDASTSISEESSGSDMDSLHRRRLRDVKALDQSLKDREDLMWYEVVGSYLNHNLMDTIRESSGLLEGYDKDMPSAADRAHVPPEGYHTFYTDQIDMGLRFPIPKLI